MMDYEKNDQLSKLNKIDRMNLLEKLTNWLIFYKEQLNIKTSRLSFGVEIEFQHASYDQIENTLETFNKLHQLKDNWLLKPDNTVTEIINNKSYGGEVISPILDNKKENWVQLKNICDMLKLNDAIAGNNSGAHIHFGSQILGGNEKYYINFLKLWFIYEKIIYRFAYGEKLSPRDSLLENAPPFSITREDLKQIIIDSEDTCIYSSKFLDKIQNRYCGLNLRNISGEVFEKGNTIEIRCPNGTINEIIWQNNINFFSKLLLLARNNNLDTEWLDYRFKNNIIEKDLYMYNKVYVKDALELCDMLYNNNGEKYDFLKQYFKNFSFDSILRDKRVSLTRKRSL